MPDEGPPKPATGEASGGTTDRRDRLDEMPTVVGPRAAERPSQADLLKALPTGAARRLRRVRELDRGGMARIDIVVDEALRRRMAMKVLDLEGVSDERALEWFLREAQLTAQLDHPAIVPVHDIGRTDAGEAYFTMKLIEGRTFQDVLDELPEPPLPTGRQYELLETVLRACEALAFAHERGVVHGDIKPQNMMVGDYGEVYVMDWGLARTVAPRQARAGRPRIEADLDDTSLQSVVAGTPAYMAPEQALGEPIDERTDVFAVGALLYHAFSGQPPFAAPQARDALERARRHDLVPLGEAARAGAVPAELERVVSKALARSPSDRHATMNALREDLSRLLRGEWEFPRVEVRAGEAVVREGDVGEEAYIILRGALDVVQDRDGEARVLRALGSGDVFGEMAMLAACPRTATVVAREDSALVVIRKEVLEREVSGFSPWMAALVRTLARRFKELEDASRE